MMHHEFWNLHFNCDLFTWTKLCIAPASQLAQEHEADSCVSESYHHVLLELSIEGFCK